MSVLLFVYFHLFLQSYFRFRLLSLAFYMRAFPPDLHQCIAPGLRWGTFVRQTPFCPAAHPLTKCWLHPCLATCPVDHRCTKCKHISPSSKHYVTGGLYQRGLASAGGYLSPPSVLRPVPLVIARGVKTSITLGEHSCNLS